MKKIILAAAACLVAVIFSGCAHFSSIQKDSWQKYENDNLGFTIEYPGDWSLVEESDVGVILSNSSIETIHLGALEGHKKGVMLVDILFYNKLRNLADDCISQDYKPVFGDANAIYKRICKKGFTIVLGMSPTSGDSRTQKKLLENIANTFRAKSR